MDMVLIYGFYDGNTWNAKREYELRFSDHWSSNFKTFFWVNYLKTHGRFPTVLIKQNLCIFPLAICFLVIVGLFSYYYVTY